MKTYTPEFKAYATKRALEPNTGLRLLAHELGVPKSTLSRWKQAETPIHELPPVRPHRQYTPAFKASVVAQLLKPNTSLVIVERLSGVPITTLSKWKIDALAKPAPTPHHKVTLEPIPTGYAVRVNNSVYLFTKDFTPLTPPQ